VLTDSSRAVLKGERPVMLRRQVARPAARRERPARSIAVEGLSPAALDLYEKLRAWRSETAKALALPAYVIFHDATLREIADARPRTLDQLRGISGVGAKKLDAYGDRILSEVARADSTG
jgi:ATP-dependent DNA helicase RecQ